jgi:type I restriction enzyme M protein
MIDTPIQTGIWSLMDRVRNELSTSEFSSLLAVLTYLRWADFLEAENEAASAFEDIKYTPVLTNELHWRSWHQLREGELFSFFHERLIPALSQLGKHRHNSLAMYLYMAGQELLSLIGRQGSLLQLCEGLLPDAVDWLKKQPFETPTDRRRLLTTFDSVLNKSIDYETAQYRTHTSVARLIATLARPNKGERVYDPAFGMGSILTNICDILVSQSNKDRPGVFTSPDIITSGVEINHKAYVIGMTRLALAGIDDPHLEFGNSLERYPESHIDKEGYDLVVADIPFGMRVNSEGLDHFPIRSHDATGFFIQHALSNLRDGGRAIIVAPFGTLFNKKDKELRRWLLERNQVQAIIALPKNVLGKSTSIRSCLLVLNSGGSTSNVRMVDAESLFVNIGKSDQKLNDNPTLGDAQDWNIEDFVRLVKSSKSSDTRNAFIEEAIKIIYDGRSGKFVWDMDIESIEEADWDLTPIRREKSELITVLDELQSDVEVSTLSEICKIMLGHNVRSADRTDSLPLDNPVPYIRIKDIQRGKVSKTSSWLASSAQSFTMSEWKLLAGDILLSKSGTIGKAGLVQNGAVGAIAAGGTYVLRIDKNRLDPHYLLAYLDSNACRSWLNERSSGSVISHLSKSNISKLPVPVPPLQLQHRIAEQYKEHKTDAFFYLTKLLSQTDSDPVAESINLWIRRAQKEITIIKGHENDLETDLENLEKIASDFAPIKYCETCSKPYWLGTIDEHPNYAEPPYNYYDGYENHCLSCWLGISEGENDSPRFDGGGPLVEWSIAINNSLNGIKDLLSIPKNVSLLNILQNTLHSIKASEDKISGHLPDEETARRLSYSLLRNLSSIIHRLLNKNELSFLIPKDTRLELGDSTSLTIVIENKGYLPLRNIQIKAEPNWGSETVTYLEPGNSAQLFFYGTVPISAKKLDLDLQWTASDLASGKASGTSQIAIDVSPKLYVVKSKEASVSTSLDYLEPPELGPSPYICGDPVRPDRNDMFFGREDLIKQIQRQVQTSGNVVLLEGNRRAGKTSILRHIEGKDTIPGWLCIYCSLQGAEGSKDGVGVPTAEVFREMAKCLARAINNAGFDAPLPDGSVLSKDKRPLGVAKACRTAISDDAAFADFQEYFEVILELLEENNLGALLMLDEFDKLQEGIDNGVTSPQVPENIRYLVQTHKHFTAILTGSRRLKRLREEYWSALFGLGTRLGVSSLSKEPAKQLVTKPVLNKISYSEEALDRIIYLTASQPYILQCLCNRIFDHVSTGKSYSVTIDLVELASQVFVQDNEHFASLWTYAGSDRRRFILALCNKETKRTVSLRLGELSELLASNGVEVTDDMLIEDLDFLRDLELISLDNQGGEGRYHLTIPLMGVWIDKQQNFDALLTQAQFETADENG